MCLASTKTIQRDKKGEIHGAFAVRRPIKNKKRPALERVVFYLYSCFGWQRVVPWERK